MEIQELKSSGAASYQGSAAAMSTQAMTGTEALAEVKDFRTEQQNIENKSIETQNCKEGEQQSQNAQLKSAVNEINRQMKNSEAIFGIHEKTNRVTIKIVDKSTKEVLKEYPPEQTLDMIAKVWEIAGILVDEKR